MTSPEAQKLQASMDRLNGIIELKSTKLEARIEKLREDGDTRGKQIDKLSERMESYDFNKNGGSTKDRVERLERVAKWVGGIGTGVLMLVLAGVVGLWFKGVEADRAAARAVVTQKEEKRTDDQLKEIIKSVMEERDAAATAREVNQPTPRRRSRGKRYDLDKPLMFPRQVNRVAKKIDNLAWNNLADVLGDEIVIGR